MVNVLSQLFTCCSTRAFLCCLASLPATARGPEQSGPCISHYRMAFNVNWFLYRAVPGRHYHLYLRFVMSFALCNGHVMTVGPKTVYFFDQHKKHYGMYVHMAASVKRFENAPVHILQFGNSSKASAGHTECRQTECCAYQLCWGCCIG